MKHRVDVASHLLVEGGDDETTQWTEEAKERGAEAVADLNPRTAQFVEVNGELICVEWVGQAPDSMKYRQGLRPERLRFLHALEDRGIRVMLVFYHGRYESAWLSTLPIPGVIKHAAPNDRDAGRLGWYAGEDDETGCLWNSDGVSLDEWPPERLPRLESHVSRQERLS